MAESLRVAVAKPQSTCLSDEDVIAFAWGSVPSSRLPEVHAHLDSCQTCQRLLNEAVRALGAAATAPETSGELQRWNTTFQRGVLVAKRYRIMNFVARGGMGEVYEACDDELQQRVALKTVTATASDNPEAVRRLKGEVQLARRVSHPNVCRIYDFGTHVMSRGTQISFLTMEFVEGETLGQCIRLGGALPSAEACALARQLLLGLNAAHDAGVLHRDFKSDNVILRPDSGADTTPLILDFGLARALDHESQHGSSGSNPTLVGTYGYIAPEQLEGKPHTRASDLYSFGVVLFEMLTGELPFESSSSPAVAALQRLHKVAPAPSGKNPEVSSALDAIVLRCLRRSPLDRFKTAAEVLAALDALDRTPRRTWLRRSWPWLALGAAALAVLSYAGAHAQAERPRAAALVETLSAMLPAHTEAASLAPPEPQSVPPGVSAQASLETAPLTPLQPRAEQTSTAKDRARATAPGAADERGPGSPVPRARSSASASPRSAPRELSSTLAAPAASIDGWEDPFHSKSAHAAPAASSP